MSICIIEEGQDKKRGQNEDKHLNFHLHNTVCLPGGEHKIGKHWLQKEMRHMRQKFPLERKKNEQIKGLISHRWLFFDTQYNSSLSSFVQIALKIKMLILILLFFNFVKKK